MHLVFFKCESSARTLRVLACAKQSAGASSLCHLVGWSPLSAIVRSPPDASLADRSVPQFDVSCRVWEESVPMPTACVYFAAAGAEQHIYEAGGTDGERAFDTVECFHTDLARCTSCSRCSWIGEAWRP